MNFKFYEYVNEVRKIFLKRVWGSRTHNFVFTRPQLYQLHHHLLIARLKLFLLKLNHAKFNFFVPLFVANVYMIYNRKAFILNPGQLSCKSKKTYVTLSIIKKRNTRLKNVEGKKGTSDLQISTQPLYHLSHSNHMIWSKLLKI